MVRLFQKYQCKQTSLYWGPFDHLTVVAIVFVEGHSRRDAFHISIILSLPFRTQGRASKINIIGMVVVIFPDNLA